MTHYIPAYAVVIGVRERSICGRYVAPSDHSLAPMCPECQTLIRDEEAREAQDAAALAELQAMPAGPEPKLRAYDALAGYRPKGGK